MFQDKAAAALLEKINYDFSALEKKSHPEAAVINLGCGLDNTGRVCDTGRCQIYNIDLPDVIELRNRLLPAGEREKNQAQ